ncbi:MAG TPA: 50S ribosomal protein L30 [Anaerolineales bacterium]|nr:50S ribosomal protein L30 [Anaerolineales bacterium]
MAKGQTNNKVIRVTLVRSPIGYTKDQRATARALGLRRMHQTVEHKDTPTLRGMIQKIVHLVQVEE